MTKPAAGDVVDDNTVARREPPHARTYRVNNAARLLARDHAAIRFRSGALVDGAVDCSEVAAAQGRRLHADQHLAVAGLRDGILPRFYSTIARQDDAGHRRHQEPAAAPSRAMTSSISAFVSSSSVQSAAGSIFVMWSGRRTPTIAAVTAGFDRTQATASWATVWPVREAMAFSASTRRRLRRKPSPVKSGLLALQSPSSNR